MGAAILGWLCIVGAILSLIAGIAALRYLFVKTNLSFCELSNLHSAQFWMVIINENDFAPIRSDMFCHEGSPNLAMSYLIADVQGGVYLE